MNIAGLLPLLDELEAYQEAVAALGTGQSLEPQGLPASARALVAGHIAGRQAAPVLILTGKVEAAAAWMQALETWMPQAMPVMRLPEPTPLPYDRGPWSARTRQGRLEVLTSLAAIHHPLVPSQQSVPLIVSSARAFLQKTMPLRRFISSTKLVRRGQSLELLKSEQSWQEMGYEQVSVVETAGQFSRRGGIVDIFPLAHRLPVRIELFGDEIETIRAYDPDTQRTLPVQEGTAIERVVIPPAREAMPGIASEYVSLWNGEIAPEANNLPSWRDDLPALEAGIAFENLEFYLPLIYSRPVSLLDYLPKETLLIVDDWPDFVDAIQDLRLHAGEIAAEQPDLPPDYPSPLLDWEEIAVELGWWRPFILGRGDTDPEVRTADTDLAYAFEPGPRFGGQVRPFLAHLRRNLSEGTRTIVLSRQASRLAELWREEHDRSAAARADTLLRGAQEQYRPLPALPELPPVGSLSFVKGSLPEGFALLRQEDNRLLVDLLTDAEIFGWNRPAPRRRRTPRSSAPENFFADIQAGDYVVHIEFGIGRFKGLVSRTIGGMAREYLLVQYANGDVLYVPVHHADRLGKWVGPDDRSPPIQRLGEKAWSRAKAKAMRAADELAGELLELYAARETVSGHAFATDNEWQAELEASFPYQETEDQLRVIAEVKADMERAQPMDRLICGDVGYGKTEVALRAAFKAVLDGKQVAMLVPTTILAQQHFNTFSERLSPFPVNVEMLSRFRTTTRQAQIVGSLREGEVDIIIGTHRLLSDDVSFKDLGLVIVDEEQRFGVAHKERLKKWRTEVDFLTMTATPIPRTLYMSLAGVRDISIIDTAPLERLPVQTFVGEMDDGRLHRAMLRELDRGGQIFVVHNRVQTIDIVRRRINKLVPEAQIAVGHGQMSERRLETIMKSFAEGDIDVLISTTIIESGLDFPNANTLIVDRAEQFGLAQLYQLRGRVGRGVRRAYAYFFHAAWRTLNADAQARLETIASETELGAGYNIAMRDMEIRGAGDILGGQQSGHISSVGFDLYTRLLTQAVKRQKALMRGEELPMEQPTDTLIDLPLAAYIPPDYVPDGGLRLRLYRRMANLETLEEIDMMAEEMADRFGAIPDPVHNLLYQLRIKSVARMAGVGGVITEAGQIKIRIGDLSSRDRYRLQRFLGNEVRVSKQAIWMSKELATRDWQVALVQVLEKLPQFGSEQG